MFLCRLGGLVKYHHFHHHRGVRRYSSMNPVPLFYTGSTRSDEHVELPRRLQRSERKPLVTGITELKRTKRAERKTKQEVREITLRPPDNGLLVRRLVPVAHEVHRSWQVLFKCASRVLEQVGVHACRVCGEVHVGGAPHLIRTCDVAGSMPSKEHSWVRGGTEHVLPSVESFHLYDRLGRAVSHEERLMVDRIPAVVELCIQAGVDVPEYPTKRRIYPVYNVAGKLIDFERKFPRDYSSGIDIQTHGFWEKRKKNNNNQKERESESFAFAEDAQEIATRGMEAWERLQSGVSELMTKYPAQTCGFCSEVQVGTKGHRARICQAYKHQMRDGQHAWQEATVDDLVPPVYVWHVPDPRSGTPLGDELKRYLGKLPAAVELFAQAGAGVGEAYRGMMREDVCVPELDEERLVV
ncbi:APO protein 3, mitochondrial-like [Zingiber officinale]|uniref:APO protein 3, mitochondrial-like n=1 Tax=Zingiber officinale TaxID=94328 RepID=UPI001C4ABEA6|nr:APO protein 3, mitochondrial-like [Zingiber officinale]